MAKPRLLRFKCWQHAHQAFGLEYDENLSNKKIAKLLQEKCHCLVTYSKNEEKALKKMVRKIFTLFDFMNTYLINEGIDT